VFEVELEEGHGVVLVIDDHAEIRRVRDGRARQAEDALDEGRLADAAGADDGYVEGFHGGIWIGIGIIRMEVGIGIRDRVALVGDAKMLSSVMHTIFGWPKIEGTAQRRNRDVAFDKGNKGERSGQAKEMARKGNHMEE
jgi:hypothetical protein